VLKAAKIATNRANALHDILDLELKVLEDAVIEERTERYFIILLHLFTDTYPRLVSIYIWIYVYVHIYKHVYVYIHVYI
jgi:hypothetical protein